MRPQDAKDLLAEGAGAVNREQEGEDQAQDVAEDRLYGLPGDDHDMLNSSKPHGGIDPGEDDFTDVVDHMKQMVTSGRIDMGAYAGEPMMDDGDTDISDAAITDGKEGRLASGEGEDDIGGGESDPIDSIADTGSDPLAGLGGSAEDDEMDDV